MVDNPTGVAVDVLPVRLKGTKYTIVSDFDDTLFFNGESIAAASLDVVGRKLSIAEVKRLPKEIKHKVYQTAYTTYMSYLKPNSRLIQLYRQHAEEGAGIIIMSARGEEFRRETEQLLEEHLVPHKDLILPRDHNMKDEEWKLGELDRILAKEGGNILFVEDRVENIKYIRERLISDRVTYLCVTRDNFLMYI